MASIILYGPGGSGKTTLAATMADLGYHPFFIDADRKIRNMINLQPYIQAKNLSWWSPSARLSDSSMLKMVQGITSDKFGLKGLHSQKRPKGYENIIEIIDDLQNLTPEQINEKHKLQIPLPTDPGKIVPIIDSYTRIQEHQKKLLLHIRTSSKMSWDEWNALLIMGEDLFENFYSLQDPEVYGTEHFGHCITIVHQMDTEIKLDDKVIGHITEPLIQGSMRDKAVTYVEEMYYLEGSSANKHQPTSYTVITSPVGTIKHARTSRELPTLLKNTSFVELFAGETYQLRKELSQQ